MNAGAQYAAVQGLSADELVEQHADLVKRIAVHLKGRLPASVETDDLIQVGLVALLEAARNFASDRGASFTTYAGIRIRGAMLDEVRSMEWVPRSVHRNQRRLTEAMREIENEQGREARPAEVAEAMGVTVEDYHRMVGDAAAGRLVSLDLLQAEGDARAEDRQDGPPDPLAEVEHAQFTGAVAEAIRSLPEREALVMALYYDEELNLKEIGKVLGVSESRVCQIHGQALVRLRSRLSDPSSRDAA